MFLNFKYFLKLFFDYKECHDVLVESDSNSPSKYTPSFRDGFS